MASTPNERRKTDPGLGALPRVNTAEIQRVGESVREGPSPESTGFRRLRETLRREEGDAPPVSEKSPRSERSPRPAPVTVDKVGDGAVRLARARKNAPHRIAANASRVAIEKAPIDTKAAFVLSLIDGDNGVEDLVDMSGMSEVAVKEILARLARLGLIALP